MTINLTTIANSQSFGTWLERTNQIINIISSNALTADASTNGSVTTGNASVNGYLSSNVLIATGNLRGGNTSTSNTLTISSNVLFVNNSIQIYANSTSTNVVFASNVAFTSNVQINTALAITGNATFTNAVSIVGNVSLSNTLFVAGATTVNNTLNVANAVIFSNTLSVTGNTVLSNAVNIGGVLTVANSANIAGNLTVVGNFNVNGTTTFVGTTIANGDNFPAAPDYYKIGNSTYGFILFTSNTSVSNSLNISNVGVTSTTISVFSNTSLQTVDSFSISTYRSAEYLVQMSNSTAFQISKLLAVHDGTNAYVTEYGVINNGTAMGVFSANVITGNFSLQCVPTSNTITAKIFKTMVTV